MAHDRRGEVPAGQQPVFMIPVLSWHAGALTVFYQRQYVDSAQRFEAAPRLTPADIQFVHNHVLLHDRGGIVVPGMRLTVQLPEEGGPPRTTTARGSS